LCGFRVDKSTIDQVQSTRQILEKPLERKVGTFHLFIYFKATYVTINRDKLLEALEEFNIPQKLIGLKRATLTLVNCRVKIHNNLSESFGTSMGLKHGDALSRILFNLALEKVVRDSGIKVKELYIQQNNTDSCIC
jgi:hypothetical protein